MKIFLTLLFSIWGLFSPESVISNNGEYFITQMGKLYVKDGTIIHMTKDKTESLLKLVDPRGMYLEDNFLWVVDFDRVVRLDLETGKYKNFYANFPRYLNDIVKYKGSFYVTDTYGNTIYRINDEKKLEVVFNIKSPNGITTDGEYLYVISFTSPAVVYKCDENKVISSFTLKDVNGGDGIFFGDNLFFVSGYNSKNVVVYNDKWEKLFEKTGFSSPADLYYSKKTLYVPDMKEGKIYVFKVENE
ncbi:hypothetical protein SU69_04295 [Thermosipho melanesiensis]|uniref:ATP/GTP-binding protein n=2 Tax=Thermosipho melanesiensis TaxID=46541 RepID=A6LLA1_THEM4|nr:hypothetical protein [Thermosipho melanesiensis]ABR30702.1 hypothetical protein Tmel_0841 [Thermosipho melanesiensis BI429]APT73832.1 hypothetical protein BW47_04525 [Thermosipho melanesiensis]OOC35771.1 hypothetical protein SU68_04350 [Thermosipho melanesiensis]OOC39070.1 hypothetical protein SU69_04295 [Thermosipho melanesiensis]OOC39218.1 hypothetical protein SU70_04295 [Thermosipho melanesiensis]